MTERRKRMLLVAGGILACAGLIIAIITKNGISHEEDVLESRISAEKESVTVKPALQETKENEEKAEGSEENKKDLVIQTEEVKQEENREENHGSDPRPPQTDKPEQSIQPDPTKPVTPEPEVLKDPGQKPDGTILTEPPVSIPHDQVVDPQETKPQPDEPKAGDTNGSQIYIPGFGWVENQGGGGSGTKAGDMYENGNKIGVMD